MPALPSALRWPLPAFAAWAAAWLLFLGLPHAGIGVAPAVAAALALSLAMACTPLAATPWRRAIVGLGFPLSLAAVFASQALPAWGWLLPLVLVAVVYPVRAWRDAPLFPTPAGALAALPGRLPLPAGARILDAGCGTGAGLRELARRYPDARLDGVEWSAPLAAVARWRCRRVGARVVRGDLWAHDWSAYDVVYVFQRPESMARALAKARREMEPGAWLASLAFAADGARPDAVVESPVAGAPDGTSGRRRVFLYRIDTAAVGPSPRKSNTRCAKARTPSGRPASST